MKAYGIVRGDRSGRHTTAHVHAIRTLARHKDFDLHRIFVRDSDADFGLLLATLGTSGTVTLVVPSVLHVTGWLDVMRRNADVWTVLPPTCWPRHPDTPS
ncbi:hypothetical protein [Nocardia sp. CNY236]|uniref:hypothetical protein n=1 Tax=Nocardia sp. CNY236 TaxID=1169152 RepID=UPI0004003602|nr:hypothetical protein [Nocardia sp. CNY236]